MLTHLLAATETPGEFGVIANLEQHSRGTLSFLDLHDATLERILDEPLPDRVAVAMEYAGEPRLIVPTKRGLLMSGEDFHLRAIVLDNSPPQRAVFLWRPLGQGTFRELPSRWVARGVHEVTPPAVDEDFEYRIEVETADGRPLVFPPSAPETHQSVVVLSDGDV